MAKFAVVHSDSTKVGFYAIINAPIEGTVLVQSAMLSTTKLLPKGSSVDIPDEYVGKIKWSL